MKYLKMFREELASELGESLALFATSNDVHSAIIKT